MVVSSAQRLAKAPRLKRRSVSKIKPRGFEPWGPHASFLSPPPPPSKAKPLLKTSSRSTVANLTKTPPRASYASKVKGIFASTSPVKRRVQFEETLTEAGHVESNAEDAKVNNLQSPIGTTIGRGPVTEGEQADGDEPTTEVEPAIEGKQTTVGESATDCGAASKGDAAIRSDSSESLLTNPYGFEKHLGGITNTGPESEDSSGDPLGDLERAVALVSSDDDVSGAYPQSNEHSQSIAEPVVPRIVFPQPSFAHHPSPIRSEPESSDSWTDDSQFLPAREIRRRHKLARLERGGLYQDQYFDRTIDVGKAWNPPQQQLKIPKGPGCNVKDAHCQDRSNQALWCGLAQKPPRPSRFAGLSSGINHGSFFRKF